MQDPNSWLEARGMTKRLDIREWKPTMLGSGNMLVATSVSSLNAYKRLPSPFKVEIVSQSPKWMSKDGEAWLFVEFCPDHSYQPLDVTSSKGDTANTFCGVAVALAEALLVRNIAVCGRLRCEAIEVNVEEGKCQLIPIDVLKVGKPDQVENSVRSAIVALLDGSPNWVKEDQQTFLLKDDLESKKRRDSSYAHSVFQCLMRARKRLQGAFGEPLQFSDAEPDDAEVQDMDMDMGMDHMYMNGYLNTQNDSGKGKLVNEEEEEEEDNDDDDDDDDDDNDNVNDDDNRDDFEDAVAKKTKPSAKQEKIATPSPSKRSKPEEPQKRKRGRPPKIKGTSELELLKAKWARLCNAVGKVIDALDTDSPDFCDLVLEMESITKE